MAINCFGTLENLTTDKFCVDLNILEDRRGKRECITNFEPEFEGFLDLEKSESSLTTAEKSKSKSRSCELEDARRSVESDGGTENVDESRIVDDEKWNVNRKRKRECYNEMLKWIRNVARNPCNPSFGLLPDRSKWKFHGDEQLWKQVLIAREQLFLKRNADSSDQQSIWQKKQKMHPAMYEDQFGFEKSRTSQRIQTLHSSKKSESRPSSQSPSSSSPALQSDNEDRANKQSEPSISDLWIFNHRRKRIPVGSHYQAKVPEWTNEVQESDKKWLGTQIWPLDKGEKKNFLIERDRIGKGRQDSCGCQNQGSVDCVRFHISEKRKKLKLELCSAFQIWKFDEMGEQVTGFWTEREEKEMIEELKLNYSSLEKGYFEMCNAFPKKLKKEIVSYFFNVFLLRRRSHQNRFSRSNIDTDDDEPESGTEKNGVEQKEINSTGSIFRSPRKVH